MFYTQIPSLRESLGKQLNELSSLFPRISSIDAVLLIGSCSVGKATYRSDIDLLIILGEEKITYDKVVLIRNQIEEHFTKLGRPDLLSQPLPSQITVVGKSVVSTQEPEMRRAITHSIPIFDDQLFLKKFLEIAA